MPRNPQEYLRHVNGRGRIFDDAEVSRTAYLSKDSIAAKECELADCVVRDNSIISDNARVFGGNIFRSFIGGQTIVAGSPEIKESIILAKSITGNAQILRSTVRDFAKVASNANVIDSTVQDSAYVYGDATIRGIIVRGLMRISTGMWFVAPRHVDLGFVAVTESKLGCMVGCRDRTAEFWFRHGPKLARRWGWSDKEIAETLLAVKYTSRGD